MVAPYVDGRPMPSSSSAFTRLASVYRPGGRVSWRTASTLRMTMVSPLLSCESSSNAADAAASPLPRSSSSLPAPRISGILVW